VSVPVAFPAVITAIFPVIARLSGETAPLLLTAFDDQSWPTSLNDFTPLLPVTIWTYAMSARRLAPPAS
jgi:phosphate transport system permease protein